VVEYLVSAKQVPKVLEVPKVPKIEKQKLKT
jgi:hypothetical protein